MKTRTTRKRDISVAREPRSPAYANVALLRVNARFDSDTASKLGEVTVGEGINVTEALKRAVILLHAKFRVDHQHKSRRPILESMIGKYSGGPPDLAENHKSYYAKLLNEKYGHHR